MTTPERCYEKDLADARKQIEALRTENEAIRARLSDDRVCDQLSRRLEAALDLIHVLTESGDCDEY